MKKLSRTIITRCNEAMIPDEITYSEANEFIKPYSNLARGQTQKAKDQYRKNNLLIEELNMLKIKKRREVQRSS